MVVNFLFPFNDALLQNYQKKEVTVDAKKVINGAPIIFILISLLFVFIGKEPHLWKAIYFCPVIFENFCALILAFIQSEKTQYLSNTINILSISNFMMSVNNITFRQLGENLADSVRVMLICELIFLILLVVGYRMHLSYQLKHVCPNKKSNWNKVPAATGAVIGCILAKLFSRELLAFLLWLLWIVVHLVLSEVVLEYRKYTRFFSINGNDNPGI